MVSQGALVSRLMAEADPDLILDVRVGGVSETRLDLDPDAISRELSAAFLKVRVRDRSIAALPDGPLPSPETIAGTFVQDLTARITAAESRGDTEAAADARAALQLGRLLLDDPRQVDLI